jgi:DNA anti-recombination protein RmuC
VATLEDAAQELVDKLEQLDGECKAAQEAFAAHLQDLAELDGNVARDWDTLTETVTAFLEKVQEQASLLAEDGTEAANELGTLRGEIEGAQSAAEAEVAGSREEIAALAVHLRSLEPAIEPLIASGAEAPFAALRELAENARQQLEQALAEAGDYLQEVVTDLGSVAQNVEERSEALRAHVAEECTEQLQSGFDTWQGNVEELEELVRAKLDELPANAREVVEYAMTECVAGHQEELDRVLALMPSIEQAIGELKVAVDETITDVGEEAAGALDERLGSVSQAITRTTEALDAVKEVLASYTFVTL